MSTTENSSSQDSSNASGGAVAVVPDPVVNGPPVVVSPPSQPAPAQGHGSGTLGDGVVQQIIGQMLAVNRILSPYAELVDPEDKKHIAKSRPGVEQEIPLLVRLCQKYGITLSDYSPDQFAGDVTLANQLTEVSEPISEVNNMLADTILVIKGRYYGALTTMYSALKQLATHDVALAQALEPLAKLFAKSTPAKHVKTAAHGLAESTTAPSSAPESSPNMAIGAAPVVTVAERRRAVRRPVATSDMPKPEA